MVIMYCQLYHTHLLGNIIGGVSLVAVLNFAQVASEEAKSK